MYSRINEINYFNNSRSNKNNYYSRKSIRHKKNRAHTLDWLPITLPIKLMVSRLDGDHTQSCRCVHHQLKIIVVPMKVKDLHILVLGKFEEFLNKSVINNQIWLEGEIVNDCGFVIQVCSLNNLPINMH
ncbi:hypothetical protein ACTFIW_007531 [Dictyostelium discoideum]